MAIAYSKNEEIRLEFENGFAVTELLKGAYAYPPVRCYRGVVKAGCSASPETYGDCLQFFCLTDGNGVVRTKMTQYRVEELSFFMPTFNEPFTFIADGATDMVFTSFVVEMHDREWRYYNKGHLSLPLFRRLSKCEEYWQDCKTPGTRSWSVVTGKQLFPIILGVVRSRNGGGTIEKGHPAVAQWNVILGDSELDLTIENETVVQKGGDFSFVPAGPDHSLVAHPGKNLDYIWFEYFVEPMLNV